MDRHHSPRRRAVWRDAGHAGGCPAWWRHGDPLPQRDPVAEQSDLPVALARHPGRVLTHRTLLHEVWGPGYEEQTNYLPRVLGPFDAIMIDEKFRMVIPHFPVLDHEHVAIIQHEPTSIEPCPDNGVIFAGYIGSLLLAGTYLAVSCMTSAMTRNQVISFIVSVLICLFLILAGFNPVTDLMARWASPALIDTVAAFSVVTHFDGFQKGVIDSRDLLYFAIVVLFFLHLTVRRLEGRRG